jgi:hypothetical protein
MVSRKRVRELKRREDERRLEAYKVAQDKARMIFRKLYEIEQNKGANLGSNIQQLFKYAKAQTAAVQKSIMDKGYQRDAWELESGPLGDGDYACYLAEDIVEIARAHKTDPQSVWQALSEQFPDVHFQVDWYDLASLLAATLREQRVAGVLEGLEMAGVEIPRLDPELD